MKFSHNSTFQFKLTDGVFGKSESQPLQVMTIQTFLYTQVSRSKTIHRRQLLVLGWGIEVLSLCWRVP